MAWITNASIVLVTVVLMEPVAWFAHRYIMHGFAWAWHKSHHQPSGSVLQMNDLFGLIFACLAIVAMAIGWFVPGWGWLYWVGAGIAVYGMFYFVLHDVLVHKRIALGWRPKKGYLARLIEAHHLHHASAVRTRSVSYGFLYAPPVNQLRRQFASLERERLRKQRDHKLGE